MCSGTCAVAGHYLLQLSHAGAVNYPMPGYFGKYVNKQFWGELQLVSGASVHARIFGSFSSILLEDLLTELGPLTERDVIITNFGAWYPRFVKQVGSGPTNMYV